MSKLKYYIQSARLRTLPLSIAGIIMGIFLAKDMGYSNFGVSLLAILTAISLQILSNYSNEYGDMQKGTDNEQRLGPKRSIQSGYLTTQNIFTMMMLFVGISLLSGIGLIAFSFQTLTSPSAVMMMLLGIGAILASIKYTVGKSAYGYAGLGDLFVFLFFGLISVCGTFYLLTKTLPLSIFLPASTIGLFSVAMLNVNNMRDIENDSQYSKKTVAVRMGVKKSKKYHLFLIVIGLFLALVYVVFLQKSLVSYLFLITLPLFVYHLYRVFKDNGKELDKQMKVVSLATILFTLLFGLGLLLR